MRRLLLAAAVLVGAAPAHAQLRGELQGYAKDLALVSRSVITEEAFLLNLARVRLQGTAALGETLRGEVWLDTEALAGSFLRSPEWQHARLATPPTWLDLEWTIAESDDLVLRQQIFRAYVTWQPEGAQLTVGRQRIAWGTGFVWNPTDLLNPQSPTAVERGERAGVDAVYGAYTLGARSRVEGVLAPGRDRGGAAAAGRVSTHLGEYDIAAMGGHFRGDWVAGGEFAGYIGDAGFRGEAAVTRREQGGTFLRAVLNADNMFPGDVYAFAELYHNGAGTRDKSRYFEAISTADPLVFGLAREYAALSVTRIMSPLVTAGLYGLANLNDGSGLAGPNLSWSPWQNVEIVGASYLFVGAADTEFGRQPHLVFASVQWFF